MLKAVIFDMDGVIVDTEPIHAKASIIVLKKYGVTMTNEKFYTFVGSTTKHLYETIKEENGMSATVEELLEIDRSVRKQLVKEEGFTPVPFTKDLIKELYKHGVKLAIASSSTPNEIDDVTKKLGITKYFDKLVSGVNVARAKPAPDIFLEALKEIGANASETLVIEDSSNGTIAAKEAGIACIGFINENSGNQDLSAASVLVESFESVDFTFLSNELDRANGKPLIISSTNRLIIRELAVDDIKSMYEIYQNPEVKEYIDDIDDYLEVEIEKHKAYIKNVYAFYGYGLWGVFSKEDKKLIGRCGIQNREIDEQNEVELGYLLDVNHWGYGYAIECATATLDYAFNSLELPRIVAVIDKQNKRSIRVATYIGMTMEKEIMDHNRPCYLYSIHEIA